MSGGQRIVKDIDTTYPHDDIYARGRTKLGQGIVTFAPGVPAFLMGLDWLEDTDFGSGSDNRIDWSKKTTYSGHFNYFQDMLELRKNSAFHADASHHVFHFNEGGNVIGFRRWDSEDDFVVVANFSNTDYTGYRIGLPQAGDWWEALNSQDTLYAGSGQVNSGQLSSEETDYDGYSQSITITLSKMALVVLKKGSIPTAVEYDPVSPRVDRLEQCFPNPFNPVATIRFSLSEQKHASIRIYDVTGRLVRTLVDGILSRGEHRVRWEGRNRRGAEVASGVYFYRLTTPGYTRTRRMILLR